MKDNRQTTQRRLQRLFSVPVEVYFDPLAQKTSTSRYLLKVQNSVYEHSNTLRGLIVATERCILAQRLRVYALGQGQPPLDTPPSIQLPHGTLYIFEADLEELGLTLEQAELHGFCVGSQGKLSLPRFALPLAMITREGQKRITHFKRNCRLTMSRGRMVKAWRVPGTPEHGDLRNLERLFLSRFDIPTKKY